MAEVIHFQLVYALWLMNHMFGALWFRLNDALCAATIEMKGQRNVLNFLALGKME